MMNWLAYFPPDPQDASECLTVNAPSLTPLLADIKHRLQTRQGFSIATLNLDHLVKLRHDRAFRRAYLAHSHVTADGNPIVMLGRIARQPLSLIPGSELIAPLAAIAAECRAPVALFGSTPTTLDRAAARLEAAHPGLRIVAKIAPSMRFDPQGAEARAHAKTLQESGAQICFLALGAPKQEQFAAWAQGRAPHIGFVSIGAGLDFIAGTQRRAPKWARAIAAEWLWRLLSNPRRLAKRYAACFAILPRLICLAAKTRWQDRPGDSRHI